MSHINEALKKAQEEKDSLYKRYKKLISGSAETGKRRKRTRKTVVTILLSTVMALAVISAVISYALWPGDNKTASHRQVVHKKIVKPDQVKTPPTSKTAGPTVHLSSNSSSKTIMVSATPAPTNENTGTPATPKASERNSQTVARVPARQNPRSTPLIAITPDGQRVTARPVEIAEEPTRPSKADQINDLYQQSLVQHRNNNLRQAENLYRQVLRLDPNFVTALNNLGVIYMTNKKDRQAIHAFTKAINIKADYVDPHYNLACLYSASGDIPKSVHYLKKAIALKNDVKIWAKNDKDLERLRESNAYRELAKEDPPDTNKDYDIYIVKKDEWIFDIIRKRYGATDRDIHIMLEKIKELNPTLSNSNIIYPGQKLLLPQQAESGKT